MMGCWFWSITSKKNSRIPTSTDTSKAADFRTETEWRLQLRILSGRNLFGGAIKIPEFRNVSTCFIMSSMFVLPHLCLPMPAFLMTCSFHDSLILCIIFFHDFCNWWLCDCWDLYLRNFPSSRTALEVSMVTLTVGSEVWRGTWCDLWIAHGSHMTHLHVQILQTLCCRCFIFWVMTVLPGDWLIVAMSRAFCV